MEKRWVVGTALVVSFKASEVVVVATPTDAIADWAEQFARAAEEAGAKVDVGGREEFSTAARKHPALQRLGFRLEVG